MNRPPNRKKTVKKANRKFMQKWNRQLVLAIARDSGSVSQVDIMRKSGLSAGAVVNITRQLRKEKFLQPMGKGKSIGGRCPVVLKFNSSAKYIISAICLYMETRIAVVDLAGAVMEEVSFPTIPGAGPEAFVQNFKRHTERLLASKSIAMNRVMSLAVSFEGMVDARNGILIHSVHLGWHNVPFKDYFKTRFGLDVYIESETCAAVLGEFVLGAGKPVNNLVYMVFGTGIGAAIVHQGRIYHGSHHMEGEIGHTVKDPSGPICKCGKRGCLEALVSGPAIIAAARAVLAPHEQEALDGKTEEEAFYQVLNMAGQGNEKAKNVLEKAARLIGLAIADVINLLDTEMVILSGYMIEKDSEYFSDMIRKAVDAYCMENPKRKVAIARGALGRGAAIVGGAMLACQDVFSLPE